MTSDEFIKLISQKKHLVLDISPEEFPELEKSILNRAYVIQTIVHIRILIERS
jgi:hypothetical protein